MALNNVINLEVRRHDMLTKARTEKTTAQSLGFPSERSLHNKEWIAHGYGFDYLADTLRLLYRQLPDCGHIMEEWVKDMMLDLEQTLWTSPCTEGVWHEWSFHMFGEHEEHAYFLCCACNKHYPSDF